MYLYVFKNNNTAKTDLILQSLPNKIKLSVENIGSSNSTIKLYKRKNLKFSIWHIDIVNTKIKYTIKRNIHVTNVLELNNDCTTYYS